MKRKAFITILCSVIAVAVVMITTVLLLLLTGSIGPGEKELKISTAGATAEYNGEALTGTGWSIVSGTLDPGHRLTVTTSGTQTTPGMSENYAKAVILDASGVDVTAQYSISFDLGILKVTTRNITLVAGSAKKIYNGEPLSSMVWDAQPATALLPGHVISVTTEGSQTEIGKSDNRIASVSITDANGLDVTAFYNIITKNGTLEVLDPNDTGANKNEASVSGGDKDALFVINSDSVGVIYLKTKSYGDYTGKLSWAEATAYNKLIFDIGSALYLPSEAATNVDANTSRVTILSNCGSYVLPYYVYMGDGSIQTSDTVIGGNVSQPYSVFYFKNLNDAKLPKVHEQYEAAYSSFVHAQYLTIDKETKAYLEDIIEAENFGDIVDVVQYFRDLGYYNKNYNTALDAEKNVVISFLKDYKSGDYRHYATAATMMFRALGVPARYTEGYAGNIEKANTPTNVYANKAHAWVEIYLDGYGWMCIEVTGSLKKIDEKPADLQNPASFEAPVIPGGNAKEDPTIKALPKNLNSNDENNEDDVSLSGPPFGVDDIPLLTIVSDVGGNIYLKLESFGDYTGTGFKYAKEYTQYLSGGRSAYYLVPYALKNAMLGTNNLNITPIEDIFVLPYYTESGGGIQGSDVAMKGDGTKSYNIKYYTWTETKGASVPDANKAYEAAYAQFVKENYLTIDAETKAYMDKITAKQKFSATDPNVIHKVAKYIQGSAKYNLKYKTALDKEDNVVIAFLDEYNEGVCRHYAAAATMMFRSLGIPARYTQGLVAQKVAAGKETVVTAAMAHAWVEVYVEGTGWVYVEVTGSASPEQDDSKPIEIKDIAPVEVKEKYEPGKVIYAKNEVKGANLLKEKGYTYEATVDGSLDTLGFGTSVITDFLIYKDGELVYQKSTGLGENKFKLTFSPGSLQLYLDEIHVSSVNFNKSKIYDGTALKNEDSEYEITSGTLAEGYVLTIIPTGSITDAGKTSASFDYKIFKNGVDCTDHYVVKRFFGSLQVSVKYIEITAGSAEKTFDGKALVCNEIDYNPADLASGEYIKEFETEGSQKSIGSSANVLRSVTIVNADGKNTTGNYEIKIKDGLLTVKKP